MQGTHNNCFSYFMEKLIEHIGKRDGTKQGTHSHKSIPTYQIQLPAFVTTQLNPSSPTRSTGPKALVQLMDPTPSFLSNRYVSQHHIAHWTLSLCQWVGSDRVRVG
jgi:hypothetical protein